MLTCRKKYFIVNNDVEEAVNGNTLLSELLYHQVGDVPATDRDRISVVISHLLIQIYDMFVGDNLVGITGDDEKAQAQVNTIHSYTLG